MPLDHAQEQKLQRWVTQKGVRSGCPACGKSETWATGELVAAPVLDAKGRANAGGRSVATVQIVCGYCGYVMWFAAGPIGLVEDS